MRLWDALVGRWTKAPKVEAKPEPKVERTGHPFRDLHNWPPIAKWWYAKREARRATKRKYPTYQSAGEVYRHKGDGTEFVIGKSIYVDSPSGFRITGVAK